MVEVNSYPRTVRYDDAYVTNFMECNGVTKLWAANYDGKRHEVNVTEGGAVTCDLHSVDCDVIVSGLKEGWDIEPPVLLQTERFVPLGETIRVPLVQGVLVDVKVELPEDQSWTRKVVLESKHREHIWPTMLGYVDQYEGRWTIRDLILQQFLALHPRFMSGEIRCDNEYHVDEPLRVSEVTDLKNPKSPAFIKAMATLLSFGECAACLEGVGIPEAEYTPFPRRARAKLALVYDGDAPSLMTLQELTDEGIVARASLPRTLLFEGHWRYEVTYTRGDIVTLDSETWVCTSDKICDMRPNPESCVGWAVLTGVTSTVPYKVLSQEDGYLFITDARMGVARGDLWHFEPGKAPVLESTFASRTSASPLAESHPMPGHTPAPTGLEDLEKDVESVARYRVAKPFVPYRGKRKAPLPVMTTTPSREIAALPVWSNKMPYKVGDVVRHAGVGGKFGVFRSIADGNLNHFPRGRQAEGWWEFVPESALPD